MIETTYIDDNLGGLLKKLATIIYLQLGPGHNEKIYQKALKYELDCKEIHCDLERHVTVRYTDSFDKTHCLESERIDIYIHEDSILKKGPVILELKAIQRNIQEPERVQVRKYFTELKKEGINAVYGIIINFPQPNSKETRKDIDYEVIHNEHYLDVSTP